MTHPVPLLYFPVLHRSMVPAKLPPDVLTCWPGLPRPSSDEGQGLFIPHFAWSPEEAKVCLDDLRGLDIDANRAALALETDRRSRKLCTETEDLDVFAGRRAPLPVDAVSAEDLRRAQRFLLTAWLQEERVGELRELMGRYVRGTDSLARSLGEDAFEQANEPDILADPSSLLPPWRFVLEHMAVFLPPEVVLYTADPGVIRSVRNAGRNADPGEHLGGGISTVSGQTQGREQRNASLCAQPLQEKKLTEVALAGELAPDWLAAPRLSAIRIALWRFLGYSQPVSGRSWLNAERLIVLAELS